MNFILWFLIFIIIAVVVSKWRYYTHIALRIWQTFTVAFAILNCVAMGIGLVLFWIASVSFPDAAKTSIYQLAGLDIQIGEVFSGVNNSSILGNASILLFILTLAFAVPFWVNIEEHVFRSNAGSNRAILGNSVMFAGFYLVLGIPIAALPSIIFLGLYLSWHYQRTFKLFIVKYESPTLERRVSSNTVQKIKGRNYELANADALAIVTGVNALAKYQILFLILLTIAWYLP